MDFISIGFIINYQHNRFNNSCISVQDEYNSVYCPDDSVIFIRVQRTFTTNGNAFTAAKTPDSSYLKELDVSLDFMNLTGDELVARQRIPLIRFYDRQPGIFFTNPNYIFFSKTEFPFSIDKLRSGVILLNIFDRTIQKYISARSTIFAKTVILGPLNPLGTYKVSLFNDDPFEIRFLSINAAYDIKFTFNYEEYGSESVNRKLSAYWIYQLPMDEGSLLPDEGSFVKIRTINGGDFLKEISRSIKTVEGISRKFIDFSYRIYVYDPAFREYAEASNMNLDIRQSQFSNINLGLGFFVTTRWSEVLSLGLDYQSLDSLCNSSITKNLNFKLW